MIRFYQSGPISGLARNDITNLLSRCLLIAPGIKTRTEWSGDDIFVYLTHEETDDASPVHVGRLDIASIDRTTLTCALSLNHTLLGATIPLCLRHLRHESKPITDATVLEAIEEHAQDTFAEREQLGLNAILHNILEFSLDLRMSNSTHDRICLQTCPLEYWELLRLLYDDDQFPGFLKNFDPNEDDPAEWLDDEKEDWEQIAEFCGLDRIPAKEYEKKDASERCPPTLNISLREIPISPVLAHLASCGTHTPIEFQDKAYPGLAMATPRSHNLHHLDLETYITHLPDHRHMAQGSSNVLHRGELVDKYPRSTYRYYLFRVPGLPQSLMYWICYNGKFYEKVFEASDHDRFYLLAIACTVPLEGDELYDEPYDDD